MSDQKHNRYVITDVYFGESACRIAALYDEKRRPLELWPQPPGQQSLLGNIYIAKTDTIQKNLNAAFVKISPDLICYLSLEDAKHPVYTKKNAKSESLAAGDELLVQVTRDALKTKAPAVTANISVAGTYAVITTGNLKYSVSAKLPKKKRAHYADLLRRMDETGDSEAAAGAPGSAATAGSGAPGSTAPGTPGSGMTGRPDRAAGAAAGDFGKPDSAAPAGSGAPGSTAPGTPGSGMAGRPDRAAGDFGKPDSAAPAGSGAPGGTATSVSGTANTPGGTAPGTPSSNMTGRPDCAAGDSGKPDNAAPAGSDAPGSTTTSVSGAAGARRYGRIIRTNAASADDAAVLNELRHLEETCTRLIETASHKSCYSLIYQEEPSWLKHLDRLRTEELEEIVTDDHDIFLQICEKFHIPSEALTTSGSVPVPVRQVVSTEQVRIRWYEDPTLSLASLYGIKGALSDALKERVWLKSGAYLLIEPTETLTVIDVNSGKNITKKDVQDYFLSVNKEAAEEIARQLRLRNLSGIIIVDFINMQEDAAKEALLMTFRAALKKDPVPTQLLGLTRLGLAEVTRKKEQRSLRETMEHQTF